MASAFLFTMNFDQSRYENPLPYPTKVDVKKEFEERAEAINTKRLTAAERDAEIQALNTEITEEFKKRREAYSAMGGEKMALFESDAEDEFGFAKLPAKVKRLIHSKAWSDGHAYGYREVWGKYDELAEIALAAATGGMSEG